MSSGAIQLMVTEERVGEEVKVRLKGGDGGPVYSINFIIIILLPFVS